MYPLKHLTKEPGTEKPNLKSDNIDRANLLNKQFQLSPYHLNKFVFKKFVISTRYNTPNVIFISKNGVINLLLNLKANKAPGPRQIKPVVQK